MAVCWRTRECDQEIQKDCQHALTDYDMCPTKCFFAACDRPTHEITTDPALVFDPEVDRSQALKQSCLYCAFFLTHGPRKQTDPESGRYNESP